MQERVHKRAENFILLPQNELKDIKKIIGDMNNQQNERQPKAEERENIYKPHIQ